MKKSMRLVLFVFSMLPLWVSAQTAMMPAPPELAATAYLLIDADSGVVMVEKNADEQLPPASLTKMMTSYILSYEIAKGKVKVTDMVTVGPNAWAQNFPGSSLMWLETGKQVSIDDLHRGIIISSGNDASVAVAEHLAGSESAFADIMNQHAKLLGMNHTHYINSHGLPDPEHYTTARDLATLAKAIIYDFPKDYELYKEKEFTYNNITTANRNTLLWRDDSVDGLKTGHTSVAGYCLVASAKKQGMRLIAVVMGTKSESARMQETQKLLSYGFRYYETHKLYDANVELAKHAVWYGTDSEVSLGVSAPIHVTIPQGQKQGVSAEMRIDDVIKAPIEKGQALGKVVFMLDGKVIKEQPLLALEPIAEAGWLGRLLDAIALFFRNLFS